MRIQLPEYLSHFRMILEVIFSPNSGLLAVRVYNTQYVFNISEIMIEFSLCFISS